MKKLTTFARVRELDYWQAVCFSTALLSRMTPNFALFAQAISHESPELLDKVLELVKESLVSPKSKINFALQLQKVEDAAPDIADYDLFGVFPANDACMAMIAALNLLSREDMSGAVVVSKLSQGSVEAYLLNSGEANDETIKNHPLMMYEVNIQNDLLDILESAPKNKQTLQLCMEIALEEKMTNIGIDLEH
jgi:uncharacterized protein YjaG (DUF416 family)